MDRETKVIASLAVNKMYKKCCNLVGEMCAQNKAPDDTKSVITMIQGAYRDQLNRDLGEMPYDAAEPLRVMISGMVDVVCVAKAYGFDAKMIIDEISRSL